MNGRRILRVAGALYFLAIAGVCGAVAWGALSNLFADYKDSPDATYILFGAIALAIGVMAIVGAIRLLRRPS